MSGYLMPRSETTCMASFAYANLHLTFFIRSLQTPDAFYEASFFFNYLTLLYNGDQLQ